MLSGLTDLNNNESSLSLSAPNNPTKNSSNSNLSQSSAADPFYGLSFKVGVAENKNTAYRSKMEDVHTYVANFAERLDWGYFAIFDGHAGKQTARWCGNNLHTLLEQEIISSEEKLQQQQAHQKARQHKQDGDQSEDEDSLKTHGDIDMKDNLFNSFVKADDLISKEGSGNSGSTAAVVVLLWENDKSSPKTEGGNDGVNSRSDRTTNTNSNDETPTLDENDAKFNDLEGGTNQGSNPAGTNGETNNSPPAKGTSSTPSPTKATITGDNPDTTVDYSSYKRMLYTANVGDLRIVLYRDGKSYRLSYDHKANDHNEINRVRESGGLIMKNRVNGILSVTRSLGDTYMKDLVVGKPFTTSTEIGSKDEFMILACDGLWDVLSDVKACSIVADSFKTNDDPEVAAKRLCQIAIDNCTTDNITVMVVRFDNSTMK